MSDDPYKHKRTCVFLMNDPILWCPKRRRRILGGPVKARLEEQIRQTADELDVEIRALEILPDPLHLFVLAPQEIAPNILIGSWEKGKSARIPRQEFAHLRRMPSLWTRSFFVSTASSVSSDTIQRYIEAHSTRD